MKITLYGAEWCSDCVHLKKFLASKNIPFKYIVITKNLDAISFLEKINNGKHTIPTLDVDGKIYVNPGISELMKIIE